MRSDEFVTTLPSALEGLLAAGVDYAGLFPPAQLPLDQALRNYASYLNGPHHRLLGRFVLPVDRLAEFTELYQRLHATEQRGWNLSVLASGNPLSDRDAIRSFNAAHPDAPITAVEFKLGDKVTLASAAETAKGLEGWVEIAAADDPTPILAQLKAVGLNAKIRTGGTTPAAIPPSGRVARFLEACRETAVLAKATAGLHHPVRGSHPLTYAPSSPCAVMFGFLNVFLAAAWVNRGASAADALAVLEEEDASAFACHPDALAWRHHRFTTAELVQARRTVLRSFGSCSFAEPIEGLQALGWL